MEALLFMPKGSTTIIKKVFADCKKAEDAEQIYEPSAGIKAGRGRKALITDDSDESILPNQVHVDVTLLIQHLKRGKGEKLKNGLASARRSAIRYYFDVIFGSPDEDEKDENGKPLWDSVCPRRPCPTSSSRACAA